MQQLTLHAVDKAALDLLLQDQGLRVEIGGVITAAAGVGYEYLGARAVGGAALTGVFGHVWLDATVLGDARVAELLDALADATYTGEPLNRLAGTSGYTEPTGADFVTRAERRLAANRPLRAMQKQWPADAQSRLRYLALAQIATIPTGAVLPTVAGELVPVTAELTRKLVRAMVKADQALIQTAATAKAAIATNPQTDPREVEWTDVADE